MCLAALRRRLARYGDQGGPQRRIPKISQETLAEIVGTTRSRINFFMNKFRDLGFIEYNGDITIKHLTAQRCPARLVNVFRKDCRPLRSRP